MGSGDPLRTVRRGEPFRPSAAAWNRIVELAASQSGANLDSEITRLVGYLPTLMWADNPTATDFPQFAPVVVIEARPTFADNEDEFRYRPALKVNKAGSGEYMDSFGVLVWPAPQTAVVPIALAGIVPCQIDVLDEGDKFAKLIDGDADKMRSHPYRGAPIVCKASGTGTKWAMIRVAHQANKHIAKVTTQITARSGTTLGTGVAEIYRWSAGTISATGISETIRNLASAIVPVDKFIQAAWDGDGLLADMEDCAL